MAVLNLIRTITLMFLIVAIAGCKNNKLVKKLYTYKVYIDNKISSNEDAKIKTDTFMIANDTIAYAKGASEFMFHKFNYDIHTEIDSVNKNPKFKNADSGTVFKVINYRGIDIKSKLSKNVTDSIDDNYNEELKKLRHDNILDKKLKKLHLIVR